MRTRNEPARVTVRHRLAGAARELWNTEPRLLRARRAAAQLLRVPAQFLDPQPVIEFDPANGYRVRFPARPQLAHAGQPAAVAPNTPPLDGQGR